MSERTIIKLARLFVLVMLAVSLCLVMWLIGSRYGL